jgi:hypothetical protein|tara:strand:+ start:225 stop:332 length:108 start_codon:yes stop_codon:yes gene_type:complete
MLATNHSTYQAYQLAMVAQGYQVIPQSLWNALQAE